MPLVSFDQEQNLFILKYNQTEESRPLYFSTPLEFKEITNSARYDFFVFYKQCPESDIFNLTLDDKTVGMIFPIQALLSNSHDKSDNEFFLKSAYATYEHCLKELTPEKIEKILDSENIFDNYTIGNIYSENTVFAVIYRQFILEKYNLEINSLSLISSLFEKGYFSKQKSLSDLILNSADIDSNIDIKLIPESLCQEEYLTSFFKELIFDIHPLAQFHFKYQIIELLMEKILYDQLEKLENKLKNKQIIVSVFQRRISDFSSEDKRIKLLFSRYSSISRCELKDELTENLKEVLKNLGRLEEIEAENDGNSIGVHILLYKFRNLVVHDYRSIATNNVETFKNINRVLNILLIDLLRNFHMPS